jgi:hypothetical protein
VALTTRTTEQNRRYRARVQVVGAEGSAVEIDVVAYQFAGARASERGFDWDANWLRVRGRVSDGERQWSFDDPCLVTSEAAELSSWLRGVANGEIAPGAYIGGDTFVEPNLSVRLDARGDRTVTLTWSFAQESAPSDAPEDVRFGDGHPVKTTLSLDRMSAAIDDWESQLRQFPRR